ncbi:MAG: AbrB/MazE/SpoVT family DNA-binding domain-containing protein [Cardiobacteriaceae bacterium]|nr:AbrB/MazE/SpoVT family DNA-binding domain-containing protein [Cardiobacteriaceae bacterium]
MQVVKLVNADNCQMLPIPKDFEFDSQEVVIERCSDGVLLRPKSDKFGQLPQARKSGNLGELLQQALEGFDDDFKIEREPQAEQIREDIY